MNLAISPELSSLSRKLAPIARTVSSTTVMYSNKELVSVAIWINDAKEDLVVGPVRQLLPRLLETPRLLLRLQHGRRSVDDFR